MYQDYPDSHIILAGNLNILSDNELVIRTGVTSIVNQPTTGNSLLDCIYVCDARYAGIRVVKSAVKSDYPAIVTHTCVVKTTISKTRHVCFTGSAHRHSMRISSLAS